MSWSILTLLYATITAVTLLTVSASFRHEPFAWASVPGAFLMLFCTYALSNVAVIAFGLDVGMRAFPSIDLVCCILSFMLWRKTQASWAAVLLVLFAFEVARHIAYLAGATSQYALFLNICYIAQLCCVLFAALVKLMGEPLGRTAS